MADVVLSIRGDTRKLPGDMQNATKIVARETDKMKGAVGGFSDHLRRAPDALEKFGSSFRQLSGEGGAVFASISGNLKNLVEGFMVGGAAGLGLAAAFQGIGLAVERWQNFQTAEAQLEQLSSKFGVTRESVNDLEQALEAAGASVDRLATQEIIRLGTEAGLTVSEVRALAGEIANLAALEGIDPTAAAQKLFAEMNRNVDQVLEKLNAAIKAKRELADSPLVEEGRQTTGDLELDRRRLQSELEAARAQLFREQRELDDLQRRRAAGQGWVADAAEAQARAVAATSERIRQLSKDLRENEGELKKVSTATDELNRIETQERLDRFGAAIARTTEEIRKLNAEAAQKQALAALRLDVEAARFAYDQEAEATANLRLRLADLQNQRASGALATRDYLRAVALAHAEHDRQLAAIQRQAAQRRADFARGTEAIKLDVAGDEEKQRVAQFNAEVEKLRALLGTPLPEGGITSAEFDDRVDAMRLKLESDLAAIHEKRTQAALQWAAQSAAIEARITNDQRVALRAQAEAQIAAVNTRANVVLYGEQAVADRVRQIRRQLKADLDALDQEEQAKARDYARQTAAMLAQASGDRLEALRIAHEAEIEEVNRAEAQKQISYQMAQERRAALEAQYQTSIREIREQEINNAISFGTQLGNGIIDGMRAASQGDAAKAMVKLWFNLFASILSFIPGAGPFGQIFSFFAGAFSEGGMVGGARTAGQDNKVVAVRGGEFITDPLTTGRFGAGFFDQLKQGIVDLKAAQRAGARVVGAGMLAQGGSTSVTFEQTNNFNGTLAHRDLLLREMSGVLRQMAIDSVSTVVRQLGLNPSRVAARG